LPAWQVRSHSVSCTITGLKRSLNKIRSLVGQLTRGHIPVFDARKNADEIGELEKDLEKHVSNLRSIAAFSRAMAEGDFTGHFQKLSQEDELGEALNRLKVSLMDSMKESETRRKEEENRTWSAQGLAKFSSLFREAEDNMEELSFQVIKELIHYTKADAGALFITRDAPEGEGPLLEISGSYAFDREKQPQGSFRFGEGLVGRAATNLNPFI
jgi:methyl-accepting chemotaxis protein